MIPSVVSHDNKCVFDTFSHVDISNPSVFNGMDSWEKSELTNETISKLGVKEFQSNFSDQKTTSPSSPRNVSKTTLHPKTKYHSAAILTDLSQKLGIHPRHQTKPEREDYVYIDYEKLGLDEFSLIVKELHDFITVRKQKLDALQHKQKKIAKQLAVKKREHVNQLTKRFPVKWKEFDHEKLEKSDLRAIERLNREIIFLQARIASIPREGELHSKEQRLGLIRELSNRIAGLESKKIQIRTPQNSDPLEDELNVLSDELAEIGNELQKLEIELQASMQKFVALYPIFISQSREVGWGIKDNNFFSRTQTYINELFKNTKFQNRFPKLAAIPEYENTLDLLYKKRRILMNKIGELNTKLYQFSDRLDTTARNEIKRQLTLKEKDVEKVNDHIEILTDKLLALENDHFAESCKKEFQTVVKFCFRQRLKENEIIDLLKNRYENYDRRCLHLLIIIIKSEMEAVESHYKDMALLDIEYNLAIPGINDHIVVEFNFDKWKSRTGNLRNRLQKKIERGSFNQPILSAEQIDKYLSYVGKNNLSTVAIAKSELLSDSMEYQFVYVISLIVGKGLSESEINDIVSSNFPEVKGDLLLDIIHFIKHEVGIIEARHREIDEHLSLHASPNIFLRPGFINSPTASRIVFARLAECLDFDVLKKSPVSGAALKGHNPDRLMFHPQHLRELEVLAGEAHENLSNRTDRALFGNELMVLNFELDHLRHEAHLARTAEAATAKAVILKNSSSKVEQHLQRSHIDGGGVSMNDLPLSLGLTAQTLKGLFAVWEIYSSKANASHLKKELINSNSEKIKLEALLKSKIRGLKAVIQNENSKTEKLSESFRSFISSFDLDAIQGKGLCAEDIQNLLKFYELITIHGDVVFHPYSERDFEAVNRGKQMTESLVRIASLAKDLYLLDCNIRMKQAVLDKDKKEFFHQCLVKGPIALGSFYQAGTSAATIAAAHRAVGFNPIGASKEALKLGLPIAGLVVGLGTMIIGGKQISRSLSEYRRNKREIEKLDKEIFELEKHIEVASAAEKSFLEVIINIRKSQKARIILNEGILAKLSGARGLFDAAFGAANITTAGVTLAGAAAVGGISATGIGLAVIAGVGILAGSTMSINEYLKQKKFAPVLKQLQKVHEAQKKYHIVLNEKILEEGLDRMHSELHVHLSQELCDLENEIEKLKDIYQAYVEGEIQTRLSTFWWIKDEQGAPLRGVLKYLDNLHNEKPDDRVILMKLIKTLSETATFKTGEDLRARAKNLVENTVLGNLKQGLVGSVGIFKSHALTDLQQ